MPRQQTRNQLSKAQNVFLGQTWQPYTPDDQQIMVFSIAPNDGINPNVRSVLGYRPQRMSLWNDLIPKLLMGLQILCYTIIHTYTIPDWLKMIIHQN